MHRGAGGGGRGGGREKGKEGGLASTSTTHFSCVSNITTGYRIYHYFVKYVVLNPFLTSFGQKSSVHLLYDQLPFPKFLYIAFQAHCPTAFQAHCTTAFLYTLRIFFFCIGTYLYPPKPGQCEMNYHQIKDNLEEKLRRVELKGDHLMTTEIFLLHSD